MKKNFLTDLWNSIFPDHKTNRRKIIQVVNLIKRAVESETVQVIVDWTPFKEDDIFFAWLKRTLPFILKEMELADTSFSLKEMELADTSFSLNDSVEESVKLLQVFNKKDRTSIWQEISGRLYAKKTGLNKEMAILQINQEYQMMA